MGFIFMHIIFLHLPVIFVFRAELWNILIAIHQLKITDLPLLTMQYADFRRNYLLGYHVKKLLFEVLQCKMKQ